MLLTDNLSDYTIPKCKRVEINTFIITQEERKYDAVLSAKLNGVEPNLRDIIPVI